VSTPKEVREYDRFGPWIIEITDIDEIPDRFLPVCDQIGDADLVFKIPRPIERRNARVGDDLYEYVVRLGDAGVEIHRHVGDGIETVRAGYDEIVGLAIVSDLLFGEFILYLAGGTVRFAFNTVSEELIEGVAGTIRRRWSEDPGTEQRREGSIDSPVEREELSSLYRVLLRKEEAAGRAVVPLIYQEERTVEVRKRTLLEIGLDLIRRPRLREALVARSADELIVYAGVPQVVRFNKGYYGYSRTVLPISQIRSVEVAQDLRYEGFLQVTMEIPEHRIPFSLEGGAPIERIRSVIHAPGR